MPSPPSLPVDELCARTAVELAALLRSGEVSSAEVTEAHLRRIEAVDPGLGAIVTLVPDRALDAARDADRRRAAGEPCGPLHGLPIAHKDTQPTAGIRTTWGSPIHRDHVPAEDSLLVERLRDAGTILVGKTNVPEFAVGSQTFNPLFGATLNPWNRERTAGGSSGGAAAAVAARLLPFADGTDFGGSLRNPASFCNVVGMRPSMTRVPDWPAADPFETLATAGPIARTVQDAALLLSAMAGPDPRAPLASSEDPSVFRGSLDAEARGLRVAWAPDFGGQLPVDPAVRQVLESRRRDLEGLGVVTAEAMPDLAGADFVFRTLRAAAFAGAFGPLLETHRDELKETLVTNTEQGLALDGGTIAAARVERGRLFQRVRAFFDDWDFLVLPTVLVPPFPVDVEWVREVDGVSFDDYLGWMAACTWISAAGHPAISVPCGFTADGLPVGAQIVGRHPDDLGLLRFAHVFEAVTGCHQRMPPIPDVPSRGAEP